MKEIYAENELLLDDAILNIIADIQAENGDVILENNIDKAEVLEEVEELENAIV